MKEFIQNNDFTTIDGVVHITMPAWWPLATLGAIYFLISLI